MNEYLEISLWGGYIGHIIFALYCDLFKRDEAKTIKYHVWAINMLALIIAGNVV